MNRPEIERVMKWRTPELRAAENRGFRWGFIAGLVTVGLFCAFWLTLAAIV